MAEKIINDKVFGEMIFHHSWERQAKLDIAKCGIKHDIKMVAEAYEGETINEAQRKAYLDYVSKFEGLSDAIKDALLKYYLNNYNDIAKNMDIPEKINKQNITKDLVIKIVRVNALFFARNGEYGFLCDSLWDEEHGICIVLSGDKPEIKEQDALI